MNFIELHFYTTTAWGITVRKIPVELRTDQGHALVIT